MGLWRVLFSWLQRNINDSKIFSNRFYSTYQISVTRSWVEWRQWSTWIAVTLVRVVTQVVVWRRVRISIDAVLLRRCKGLVLTKRIIKLRKTCEREKYVQKHFPNKVLLKPIFRRSNPNPLENYGRQSKSKSTLQNGFQLMNEKSELSIIKFYVETFEFLRDIFLPCYTNILIVTWVLLMLNVCLKCYLFIKKRSGLKWKNWIENPNPKSNLKMNSQSQFNRSNRIAIRIERFINPIQTHPASNLPCLFARTFECPEAGLEVNVSVSSSSCLPLDEVRVFHPPSSAKRTSRIRSGLPRRPPRPRSWWYFHECHSRCLSHCKNNGNFFLRFTIAFLPPNLWNPRCNLKVQTPFQNTHLSSTLSCCAHELTANLMFSSWATLYCCKSRPANLIFNWSSVHLNWGELSVKICHWVLKGSKIHKNLFKYLSESHQFVLSSI